MKLYFDVLLDSFLDSVKILPILILAYILIELIEHKFAHKLQNKKFLNGKWGPVVGSLVGSVPECGFSVVSSDLFSRKAITVGTLVSVFIATSDEAVPIMLTSPSSYKSLILLIACKIVIAIIVGYLATMLYKLIFKNTLKVGNKNIKQNQLNTHEHDIDNHEHEHNKNHNHHNELDFEKNANNVVGIHDGCCHHHVETKKFDIWHPLFHSLKIFCFIFVITFLFGLITHVWVGEERLINWLSFSVYTQPLLCVLIGLIPNCASSVVLTELYLLGGLRFSCLLAGLMVNAGLGVVFLIKLNKNKKQNLFVISVLLISALIIGYGFIWLVI